MRVGWFSVFDQALRSSAVVAVWSAVEAHLERPLTRAELTASRRAANRYAAVTEVRVLRVPAPAAALPGGVRTIPLLIRSDAGLADVERLDRLGGRITDTAHRAAQAGQRAESVITAVTRGAAGARGLRTGTIDPAAATALAEELADALVVLADLEHRLRQHGRA